jgi:glucose/arabinose dehydrogenase
MIVLASTLSIRSLTPTNRPLLALRIVYPWTMMLILSFLCLGATFVAGQKNCPSVGGSPKYAAPVVAKGFTARVVISGLTRPRGMIFDSEGNLLVVQNRKEITGFRMTNAGGCVKTAEKRTVLPAAMGQGDNVCPCLSEVARSRTEV